MAGMRALMVLVVMGGCAGAAHRIAQITEVTAYSAMACDYDSTRTALNSDNFTETNMVLGPTPDGVTLLGYYAIIESGIWFENRVLPSWARIAINTAVTFVGFRSDHRNASIGVPHCGL